MIFSKRKNLAEHTTLEGKRAMIAKLSQKYPIQIVCEILACALSTLLTYYYEGQEEVGDEHLLTEIETIVMRRPYYGYRHVTQQLKHT